MKLGNFEGSPEEFKDICENQGFKPEDFLTDKPQFRPELKYIYISVGLLVILSLVLYTIPLNESLQKIIILLSFVSLVFATVLIHLKFNNWIITTIILVSSGVMLSLCLGFITPKEALQKLLELKDEKKDEKK